MLTKTLKKAVIMALIGFVRLYQILLSPLLGPNCRYAPTCSAYTIQALQRFGPLQGSWIAVKRIARCHPFGGSGYDPVPRGDPVPLESSEHGCDNKKTK